jgi:hypothetical protein
VLKTSSGSNAPKLNSGEALNKDLDNRIRTHIQPDVGDRKIMQDGGIFDM